MGYWVATCATPGCFPCNSRWVQPWRQYAAPPPPSPSLDVPHYPPSYPTLRHWLPFPDVSPLQRTWSPPSLSTRRLAYITHPPPHTHSWSEPCGGTGQRYRWQRVTWHDMSSGRARDMSGHQGQITRYHIDVIKQRVWNGTWLDLMLDMSSQLGVNTLSYVLGEIWRNFSRTSKTSHCSWKFKSQQT